MILQHLVIENGVVQSETQLDRVACWQVNLLSLLIGDLGVLLNLFQVVTFRVLGNVAVVVASHLHKEGLGIRSGISVENVGLNDADDLLTVLLELGLNLGLVVKKSIIELRILGVLLDGKNGAACGALARNEVLECDRKEVPLVSVHALTLHLEHVSEEVNHVVVAFSLLGNAGEENFLFNFGHLLNTNAVVVGI